MGQIKIIAIQSNKKKINIHKELHTTLYNMEKYMFTVKDTEQTLHSRRYPGEPMCPKAMILNSVRGCYVQCVETTLNASTTALGLVKAVKDFSRYLQIFAQIYTQTFTLVRGIKNYNVNISPLQVSLQNVIYINLLGPPLGF
jgi:succinylglutamate desuccinylase